MSNTTPSVPCDVRIVTYQGPPTSAWEAVARSLRMAAGKTASFSLLTIHILTDEMGRPVVWTNPKCKRIEPGARGPALKEFLETFSE